jgi:hypothetical protein
MSGGFESSKKLYKIMVEKNNSKPWRYSSPEELDGKYEILIYFIFFIETVTKE